MRYDRKLLNIDLSLDSCLATSERFQELFTALKNAQGLSYNVNRTGDYHHFVLAGHSDDAGPLPQRIAAGQRSVLFAHHADYAAATTTETPGQAMPAFAGAAHYLLDTRLMMAWARAYAERGDVNRARYLAQRLREFHHPESDEFFAACEQNTKPRPFQCESPSVPLT